AAWREIRKASPITSQLTPRFRNTSIWVCSTARTASTVFFGRQQRIQKLLIAEGFPSGKAWRGGLEDPGAGSNTQIANVCSLAGNDVPLMGIIAAVAAPPGDLSEDPFYSMNRSTEPTQRTGNVAVTSQASSGAAVQTAILKG